MANTMTKAERIYNATRYECKKHIEDWGYQTNPDGSSIGYGSVICRDDESVCTRTLNEIEKILINKRNGELLNLKLGIHDSTRFEKENQILNMIESTIRNNRKALAEIFE
jgi:hypothetical protein